MLLREEVVINKLEENEYIIENKLNNSYIKMGKNETEFLLSFSPEYKGIENTNFNEEQKDYLIKTFLNLKLLKDENNSDELKTSIFDSLKRLDISKIKLYTCNPDKWFAKILPITKLLTSKRAAGIYAAIIIIAMMVAGYNKDIILNRLSTFTTDINVANIINLYILIILTIGIHEFSHGITCKKYTNKVSELGIMLLYLQPVMYCNVSSIYLIKNKRHKIIVFMSGIISQLILSSVAILVYFLFDLFGYRINILIYYSLTNLGVAIYNLVPLIKLDGYWVISTLLDIKNLREKSINLVLALILRANIKERNDSKKITLFIYGVLSMAFTGLIWTTLLIKVNSYANSIQNDIVQFVPIGIAIMILIHFVKVLYLKKKKFSLGGCI